MKKVKKYAELCWNNPRQRYFLFFLLTCFILLTYGYYFGTFDQASHIPFLKKTIDPSLFPKDHFFDLREIHYSFFWLLFVPFYKIGLLEVSVFITHIIVTYLTFWALWNLSKTLFNKPLTSLLVVISSAFPHIGFSGFPLFEFSLLNRTATLPFEMVALNYYVKKNYFASFLILGILYNFHALSVHFVLAMIGVDMIINLIQKRNFHSFKSIPFFFLTAFPVLYWKFSQSGDVPLAAQWEWFKILNLSTFFHLFNYISVAVPVVNLLTVGGVATLILFFIAKKQLPKSEMHETMTHFMIGGIIVLLVQLLATTFYPVTIIIQAQVVRIGMFLSLFAYMYAAAMIALRSSSKNHFMCFTSSLILSFSPLFLLISLLFWRIKQIKILHIITLSTIVLFAAILGTLLYLGFARPGIYIWPRKTAYYYVQVWANKNTPKTALFFIPPALWSLYDAEWRVVSERSTVSTLSELLEGAFDPSYLSYWKPRFKDVAPGALAQFKGNSFENFKIANVAYYKHSASEFIALGKKYKAFYLVVEKNHLYQLPLVYKNKEYAVYSLKDLVSE